MRPLSPRPLSAAPGRPRRGRRDPSPSLWRFRLERLMRRASVRFALRRLAPPALLLALGAWLWGQEAAWVAAREGLQDLRRALAERPEFAVSRLELEGGSAELRARVARRLDLRLPASSLDLDLAALRAEVETVPGVLSASAAITPAGALRVALTERAPVALWRFEGQLLLVDAEGVAIGPVVRRADRPDLPLIAGPGANRAVPEALALARRAARLADRVRGLVRVGDRRWDLVLTGPAAAEYARARAQGAVVEHDSPDMRVMLPETGAEDALARVLALDAAEDLLSRDLLAVDMRDPSRPTLRLTGRALTQLLRLRAIKEGEDA
ncbi:cell division protein FtsQ/DivIB [Oceanicella actignis]|uniref:Cell division protein FtsQ n=1 Tax=Oceanicella actignis TaxID=1189325 RepID=A0A1M7SAR1_9RHOB|nr:cell division protein FtsQ/DivIB [Oceanicella actignis]SET28589.1 cell division protein FtsQ [Oceanicella actignis]SHN55639.1 cell division protein FtsQ [Oceanicella actignis]